MYKVLLIATLRNQSSENRKIEKYQLRNTAAGNHFISRILVVLLTATIGMIPLHSCNIRFSDPVDKRSANNPKNKLTTRKEENKSPCCPILLFIARITNSLQLSELPVVTKTHLAPPRFMPLAILSRFVFGTPVARRFSSNFYFIAHKTQYHRLQ